MTLALDTNVLIELVRGGKPLVRARFDEALAARLTLTTSLIVLHELLLGCELYRDPAAEHQRVQALLTRVRIEPFDEADMMAAARLRAALTRRGERIGGFDSLIAGQALARDWTVVTANTREFGRVEGLRVIDWTLASD